MRKTIFLLFIPLLILSCEHNSTEPTREIDFTGKWILTFYFEQPTISNLAVKKNDQNYYGTLFFSIKNSVYVSIDDNKDSVKLYYKHTPSKTLLEYKLFGKYENNIINGVGETFIEHNGKRLPGFTWQATR